MNCLPQLGKSHTCGRMPLWIRSGEVSACALVLRPKLLTMTCKVTASRETLTARRAREGFGRARVRCGSPAVVLDLVLHLHLLLGVRVVGRVRNVVVVVEHGHRRLHLRG